MNKAQQLSMMKRQLKSMIVWHNLMLRKAKKSPDSFEAKARNVLVKKFFLQNRALKKRVADLNGRNRP